MTFILGLTGGIATGKSTVARYLLDKGIPVVDADLGARAVVEPNTPGLRSIQETFGDEVLHEDGSLDRKKLGTVVFADEEKLKRLNALLRSFIRAWIKQETEKQLKNGAAFIVWDIPLLYEAGYEQECDAVLVVYAPEHIQEERLMKRNHLTRKEARQRMESQLSIEEKRRRADIVIDNSGALADTYRQVDCWLEENAGVVGFFPDKLQ